MGYSNPLIEDVLNDNSNQGNDYSRNINQQSFAMDKSVEDSFNHDTDVDVDKTEVDDSYNQVDSTEVEVEVEDSFNDESTDIDTDIDTDIGIEDSLNDNSNNSNQGNDNSNNSNQGNDYSDNSDQGNTDVDVGVEDSFNYAYDDADVSLADAFNDKSVDVNLEVGIEDSFNIDDADETFTNSFNDASTSLGNIDLNFEGVFNNAFGGGGGNNAFAVSQVADIVDNDSLSNVTQNNGGGNFQLYATSGDAGFDTGSHNWDAVSNPFGQAGGDFSAVADASSNITASAFNMDLVLGANLQQNAMDVSIVGGDTYDNDSSSDTN